MTDALSEALGMCPTCLRVHDRSEHGEPVSPERPRCESVYPPSADAPHEGAGWSGPLRCTLSPHEHDLHLNDGISWRDEP